MTGVLREVTPAAASDGAGKEDGARRIAKDRSRVPLKELQHRVRNSMATARAIARHSVTGGRAVEECVDYLDGRIPACARVRSAAIREPLAGLDLELLWRDALTVPASPDRQARIKGPKVSLRPRGAEQLAIAFHELATNALVHGALRGAGGRVELSRRRGHRSEGERLSFRWAGAMPPAPEGPPGFGTQFPTKCLAYTLKAEVTGSRGASGMTWEIAIPDPSRPETVAHPPDRQEPGHGSGTGKGRAPGSLTPRSSRPSRHRRAGSPR